ncbi:hypothetical protein ACFY2R_07900 [Micromonospora olivasterospora]|uniref:Streptogrisin C n=1 Tax=Micromonospora olivasterospora TaxID=1880 RepID=A0A562I3Z9_MICOL|nr:hypothetical protein [Micromonospora olivasterospora]TWH65720.1 hypothetical protein JD77_00658 [Micromonospora olivasterospora]
MIRFNHSPNRRAVLRRAVVVAGAVVLAAGSLTGPASAAGKPVAPGAGPAGVVPGGFATWSELIAVQTKLNNAAEKILTAKGAGFAGIVAAPENREVRVYWKGDSGASVRSLVADLNRTVPVRVLPARHSEKELTAAARRLAAVPGVVGVSPKVDGSGVQVTVSGDTARVGAAPAVRDSGVAVSIVRGEQPVATYDRQADIPNYYGGGRFWSPVGGCSTGFAINVGGAQQMITAGHCGENGQAVTTGAGVGMGTIHSKITCQDIEIINTPSWGRVFTGGPYSNTSVAIGGAASSFVGNYVNTSGSTSGEHGSVQVTGVNMYVAVGGIPCGSVGPLVQARQTGGLCAVAPGDSGGPVIAYRTDGRANALGTMTAGAVAVPNASCPGTIYTPGYNYVYYAPIPVSLGSYGASIVTS